MDKASTQEAICLGSCGNLQGGFKFMSLQTGQNIIRYNWDVIPIPQTVIDRVNFSRKESTGTLYLYRYKNRQIGEFNITEVEGDQNLTPQILIE